MNNEDKGESFPEANSSPSYLLPGCSTTEGQPMMIQQVVGTKLPPADQGVRPKVPSNSQISRMSVKELAVTMIIKETSHKTRDLIEDTSQEMKEQLKENSYHDQADSGDNFGVA